MSSSTVQEAIDIIDRAVDHVNEYGFNILAWGRKGVPACYIGTVFIVSGYENGVPSREKKLTDEQHLAFSVLDDIAKPLLQPQERESIDILLNAYARRGSESESIRVVGKYAERYGFQCADSSNYRGGGKQTAEALRIFAEARATLVDMLEIENIESILESQLQLVTA